MRIVSRSQWGAQHADGFGPAPLPARGLVLHHSVTRPLNGPAVVRELERIGQQRFGGGISYTFAVTPDGTVYQGHSVDRRGAHTKGHNSTVRAVVLVGDYSDRLPTVEQEAALVALLRHGVAQGWWPTAELLGGHRDLVHGTACPGTAAHRRIPAINRMAGTTVSARPVLEDDDMAYIGPGSSDGAVRLVQRCLVNEGKAAGRPSANLMVDGDYGPKTTEAVRAYQENRVQTKQPGLVDGVTAALLFRWENR